jgi:two-component system, NtrC family, sensor histidine kinase HydH
MGLVAPRTPLATAAVGDQWGGRAGDRPELQRESTLILLNLAVLAGIAVAQVLFGPVLGNPSRLFFYLLFGRFLMQTIELIWLQTGAAGASRSLLHLYSHVAIWLHLLFGFFLAVSSSIENGHYVVLMLIPVIASAFRYRWTGIAVVVSSAGALTFLQVRLYEQASGMNNLEEYFEAANVVLIYIVVAAVVTSLARRLHGERLTLQRSLGELERTRDLLVQEEKLAAVGRLAGAIAHEIRNPVAMIVSSAEMSRSGAGPGLGREELLQIVTQEAQRLEKLTNDFLTYARRRTPSREPASVEALLGYVADLMRGRLGETGLTLAVECPPSLAARFDPFQMQQVLLNLLMNAVDAASPGNAIRLVALAGGRDLTILVENPGAEIPPEARSRLFEPFFTTKASGSGLGLAIARKICEEHGGSLALEPSRPGRTLFAVRLPDAVLSPEPVQEVAAGAHPDRR